MAYSVVPTVTTGDLWTAANHNTYVRDNFAASIPDLFTTKGDLAVSSGADAAGRLPAGSDGQAVMADSAETLGLKYSWGLIPIGGIIIWSGSVGTIPTGFSLCNGASGTPDLRDKFVVGAGSTYAVGASGGAATHTHTQGATGAEAAHTHTQGVTGAGGSHTHSFSGTTGGPSTSELAVNAGASFNSFALATHTHSYSGTSGAEATHTHTNPTTAAGSSHTHTNPTTDAGSSLPPYYALCYIMRTS